MPSPRPVRPHGPRHGRGVVLLAVLVASGLARAEDAAPRSGSAAPAPPVGAPATPVATPETAPATPVATPVGAPATPARPSASAPARAVVVEDARAAPAPPVLAEPRAPVPVDDAPAGARPARTRKNLLAASPTTLFGFVDVAFARAVARNLALGASASFVGTSDDGVASAAATAAVYFERAFDGGFLEAGLVSYATWATDRPLAQAMEDRSHAYLASVQGLFGWHWRYGAALGVAAAAGLARRIDRVVDEARERARVLPAGYLRVTYAF